MSKLQFPTCSLCGGYVSYQGDKIGWVHVDVDVYDHVPPDPYHSTSINMHTMLTGDVNRLRYIVRYSTSPVLHRENVAEHSYYVSLYGMFLCRWVKMNTTEGLDPFDELTVLRRCLLHDMDEARTGDFQRPFKYRRPALKLAMDMAAGDEFKEIITELFVNDPEYVSLMVDHWEDDKDETRIGRIVSFADYLSVISYLHTEVSYANIFLAQHYESLCEYSHRFDGPEYDFLRPLINQTRGIFCKMLESANLNIDLEVYRGKI